MQVKIKKLHVDAVIPKYATDGSSGFDLHALEAVALMPGETKLIKTGLAFSIPKGYEMQVRPRSGMSLKTPFRINNSPGTVDSDYSGEVCIIGMNVSVETEINRYNGKDMFYIKAGDRIAQGVICPIQQVSFIEVSELEETKRADKGFGSSGK